MAGWCLEIRTDLFSSCEQKSVNQLEIASLHDSQCFGSKFVHSNTFQNSMTAPIFLGNYFSF